MQIVTVVLKITTIILIPSFTDNLPLSFSFLCKLNIQMYVSIIHAILLTNTKSADLLANLQQIHVKGHMYICNLT